VSRVWRKVKSHWNAWNARSLADKPIVRLILDGTVLRVPLDREAASISLLVVISVRADGQGGARRSHPAWRPEFLIVDGAPGLENAIAAVWDRVPVQRCTVHKYHNLLAHAPGRLHEEVSAD
jgi:putative transposase